MREERIYRVVGCEQPRRKSSQRQCPLTPCLATAGQQHANDAERPISRMRPTVALFCITTSLHSPCDHDCTRPIFRRVREQIVVVYIKPDKDRLFSVSNVATLTERQIVRAALLGPTGSGSPYKRARLKLQGFTHLGSTRTLRHAWFSDVTHHGRFMPSQMSLATAGDDRRPATEHI